MGVQLGAVGGGFQVHVTYAGKMGTAKDWPARPKPDPKNGFTEAVVVRHRSKDPNDFVIHQSTVYMKPADAAAYNAEIAVKPDETTGLDLTSLGRFVSLNEVAAAAPERRAAAAAVAAGKLAGIVRLGPGGNLHARRVTVTVNRGGKTVSFPALEPVDGAKIGKPHLIKAGFPETVALEMRGGRTSVHMSAQDAVAFRAAMTAPATIPDLGNYYPITIKAD